MLVVFARYDTPAIATTLVQVLFCRLQLRMLLQRLLL